MFCIEKYPRAYTVPAEKFQPTLAAILEEEEEEEEVLKTQQISNTAISDREFNKDYFCKK